VQVVGSGKFRGSFTTNKPILGLQNMVVPPSQKSNADFDAL